VGVAFAPFHIFRLAFARNREYSFEGFFYRPLQPLDTPYADAIGGCLASVWVSKMAERERHILVMSQAASWGDRNADASGGST
jgi:hypothetical protein